MTDAKTFVTREEVRQLLADLKALYLSLPVKSREAVKSGLKSSRTPDLAAA
jgi:hypothetical protein